MDAAGELAKFSERKAELLARSFQQCGRSGRVFFDLGRGATQVQRHRDEALLRAVVKVSFEAPALSVAGIDDARPGLSSLLELGTQVGDVSLVLECKACCTGDCVSSAGSSRSPASCTRAATFCPRRSRIVTARRAGGFTLTDPTVDVDVFSRLGSQ